MYPFAWFMAVACTVLTIVLAYLAGSTSQHVFVKMFLLCLAMIAETFNMLIVYKTGKKE